MTYREAIRKALNDSMTEDKNVVLLGEDVGIYGGCFKVTEGLKLLHPNQVIDTPVSEEAFTGMAVGAAMMGLRPVVEIMYADFFSLIVDSVINHAAKTHFMSGGQFCCPITIRLPEGSGTGHGPQHTQSPESVFMNFNGLKIVTPSCISDAYFLLREAIKDNNPVVYFEHKLLYDMQGEIESTPLKIGKCRVLRDGTDVTIISYSHATVTALATADLLQNQGINASVVDLCTIKPIDTQTIFQQVQKTGNAVLMQNPSAFGGIMNTVSSLISSDSATFKSLKNPIKIIGGINSPIPFNKELEKKSIPQPENCAEQILSLLKAN